MKIEERHLQDPNVCVWCMCEFIGASVVHGLGESVCEGVSVPWAL